MKVAPVQLLKIDFKKVFIEVDTRHAPKTPPNPRVEVFVFEGVNISSQVSIGEVEPDNERGRVFMINLRVLVDNKEDANHPERQFSPYLIDVEAEGFVVVLKNAGKVHADEDLAAVNGAAMLWASAREQVLVTTSRMTLGPVTLPSVSFLDLKQWEPPPVPSKKSSPKRTRSSSRT